MQRRSFFFLYNLSIHFKANGTKSHKKKEGKENYTLFFRASAYEKFRTFKQKKNEISKDSMRKAHYKHFEGA